MNELLIPLAAIFLFPLIPAFILYKFLPSKTNITGPFKGLNLKLTGAFGAYFLLILAGSGFYFALLAKQNNYKTELEQKKLESDSLRKIIASLQGELNAPFQSSQEWTITGKVASSIPEQTRIFFDDDVRGFSSTGRFDLIRRCALRNGKAILPLALCIFNKSDGYKVIDLGRELNSGDISFFNILFNDTAHTITINNPIDIKSKHRDSINYINNYADKFPEIKQAIQKVNPGMLRQKTTLVTDKPVIRKTP